MTPPAALPRAFARALAAAVTLLTLPALVPAARAATPETANFDARPEGHAAAPGERARDRLRDRLGRFGSVSLDPHTETVRAVGKLDGFLTGPSGRDGADVALGFVRDNAAALGVDAGDVDGLRLVDRSFTDGVEHLKWEQRYRGVPVADAGLDAAVTGAGRLMSVTGPPAHDVAVRSVDPAVGARAAYAAARRSGGAGGATPAVAATAPGVEQRTTFGGGGAASLSLYRSGDGFRLAWRVLAPVSTTGVYDVLVDARSGAVIRRANRVKFAVDAKVFRYNPARGAQETQDFAPWLSSPSALSGPNAHAFLDVKDKVGPQGDGTYQLTPDAGSDVAPVAGGYQFTPSTIPSWGAGTEGDGCAGTATSFPSSACTWDARATGVDSWAANEEQSATQLFYFVNRFHDYLQTDPGIKFDDAAGAFSRAPAQPLGDPDTGPAGDPVLAQALDGADTAGGLPDGDHVNNANFLTLPDGYPGLMQMYLWKSPFGGYDGANDASVVFHEYTHGMTDRLVTDAAGYGALNTAQAHAASEGLSDFYALDKLVEDGLQPDGGGPDVRFARYLDNQTGTTVRFQSIDCPTDATAGLPCKAGIGGAGSGGFTYGDFGKIENGPEPHADGEILAETLWDLRSALIAELGTGPGVARTRAYVTNALRIAPPEPSYLDLRNAVLESSVDDDALIWQVFANRGMGYFATTGGSDDTTPAQDTTDPADLIGRASVQGTVKDQDGQAVAGATVGIAGFDTGIGPQLSAQTSASGAYTIGDVPVPAGGTHIYPVRARKAAYADSATANASLSDGVTTTSDLQIERDWSSDAPGAGTGKVVSVTGPDHTDHGCGPAGLIDDSLGTVWGSSNVAGGQRIVVDLGAPIDVGRIAIDPAAGCGDDAGAALGTYRLRGATGPAGPFVTLKDPGTFTAADNGTLATAYTGTAPRIRYVELTALTPQGGSGEPYIDVAELHVARVPGSAVGPSVTTGFATGVGTTGAQAAGTITTRASAAQVEVEYGTTTAYGSTASAGSVPAGSNAATRTATLGGLAAATTYHYRTVAVVGGNRFPGADATFKTAAAVPTPTPTPTPTVIPPPPPPPEPRDPKLSDTKLSASRKGMVKVRVFFGDKTAAGTARIRLILGKRIIAAATVTARAGGTATKTLRLTRKGRKAIRPGKSRKVVVELRLPGGQKVKGTLRLTRAKR